MDNLKIPRGPVFKDLFKSSLGRFPSKQPIGIHDGAWFYEETNGINVIAELRSPDGKYTGTTQTLIRWSVIERSLERRKRSKVLKKLAADTRPTISNGE